MRHYSQGSAAPCSATASGLAAKALLRRKQKQVASVTRHPRGRLRATVASVLPLLTLPLTCTCKAWAGMSRQWSHTAAAAMETHPQQASDQLVWVHGTSNALLVDHLFSSQAAPAEALAAEEQDDGVDQVELHGCKLHTPCVRSYLGCQDSATSCTHPIALHAQEACNQQGQDESDELCRYLGDYTH